MNVTKEDLIAVLQEEAYRRSSQVAMSGTPQQVAMEIGRAVNGAFEFLIRGGYLPMAMPPPRDIVVDYDRMRMAPQFVVTVRF